MKYSLGTLPSSLRSGRGCCSFGFPPPPSQNINLHPGKGLGSELKNTTLSRPGTLLLAEWRHSEAPLDSF